ncbi:MAG: S1 RNA-binding domain-containing protein, partial [PS1 clade bacterium]|nr:S1 RNA-binding domain-containing protein [PS1 clade bacterium]
VAEGDVTAFIRRSDLSRDRQDQRPERFHVGDKLDAMVTNLDKRDRRVGLSIKALEIAEEKEAVAQYGSSDSGASLGDILGAALNRDEAPAVEEVAEELAEEVAEELAEEVVEEAAEETETDDEK